METIFVKDYSEMPAAIDLIKKSTEDLAVVVDDRLWDMFLYVVTGPVLPIERLVQAKATGTTYANSANLFTHSKWVKGNPPEKTFNQEVIDQVIIKIREGIKRREDFEEKALREDMERRKNGGPFEFSGLLKIFNTL